MMADPFFRAVLWAFFGALLAALALALALWLREPPPPDDPWDDLGDWRS